MLTDWHALSDELQLALAQQAMRHAAEAVAAQADALAGAMEGGALQDRGGPDALRRLAAVVRATMPDGAAGCA